METLVEIAKRLGIKPDKTLAEKLTRLNKDDPYVAYWDFLRAYFKPFHKELERYWRGKRKWRALGSLSDEVYHLHKEVDRQLDEHRLQKALNALHYTAAEGVRIHNQLGWTDWQGGTSFIWHSARENKADVKERFVADIDLDDPNFLAVIPKLDEFIKKYKSAYKVTGDHFEANRSDPINIYMCCDITPEIAAELYGILKPVLNGKNNDYLDGFQVKMNGRPIKGFKFGPEPIDYSDKQKWRNWEEADSYVKNRAQKDLGAGLARQVELLSLMGLLSMGQMEANQQYLDLLYYLVGKEGENPFRHGNQLGLPKVRPYEKNIDIGEFYGKIEEKSDKNVKQTAKTVQTKGVKMVAKSNKLDGIEFDGRVFRDKRKIAAGIEVIYDPKSRNIEIIETDLNKGIDKKKGLQVHTLVDLDRKRQTMFNTWEDKKGERGNTRDYIKSTLSPKDLTRYEKMLQRIQDLWNAQQEEKKKQEETVKTKVKKTQEKVTDAARKAEEEKLLNVLKQIEAQKRKAEAAAKKKEDAKSGEENKVSNKKQKRVVRQALKQSKNSKRRFIREMSEEVDGFGRVLRRTVSDIELPYKENVGMPATKYTYEQIQKDGKWYDVMPAGYGQKVLRNVRDDVRFIDPDGKERVHVSKWETLSDEQTKFYEDMYAQYKEQQKKREQRDTHKEDIQYEYNKDKQRKVVTKIVTKPFKGKDGQLYYKRTVTEYHLSPKEGGEGRYGKALTHVELLNANKQVIDSRVGVDAADFNRKKGIKLSAQTLDDKGNAALVSYMSDKEIKFYTAMWDNKNNGKGPMKKDPKVVILPPPPVVKTGDTKIDVGPTVVIDNRRKTVNNNDNRTINNDNRAINNDNRTINNDNRTIIHHHHPKPKWWQRLFPWILPVIAAASIWLGGKSDKKNAGPVDNGGIEQVVDHLPQGQKDGVLDRAKALGLNVVINEDGTYSYAGNWRQIAKSHHEEWQQISHELILHNANIMHANGYKTQDARVLGQAKYLNINININVNGTYSLAGDWKTQSTKIDQNQWAELKRILSLHNTNILVGGDRAVQNPDLKDREPDRPASRKDEILPEHRQVQEKLPDDLVEVKTPVGTFYEKDAEAPVLPDAQLSEDKYPDHPNKLVSWWRDGPMAKYRESHPNGRTHHRHESPHGGPGRGGR